MKNYAGIKLEALAEINFENMMAFRNALSHKIQGRGTKAMAAMLVNKHLEYYFHLRKFDDVLDCFSFFQTKNRVTLDLFIKPALKYAPLDIENSSVLHAKYKQACLCLDNHECSKEYRSQLDQDLREGYINVMRSNLAIAYDYLGEIRTLQDKDLAEQLVHYIDILQFLKNFRTRDRQKQILISTIFDFIDEALEKLRNMPEPEAEHKLLFSTQDQHRSCKCPIFGPELLMPLLKRG